MSLLYYLWKKIIPTLDSIIVLYTTVTQIDVEIHNQMFFKMSQKLKFHMKILLQKVNIRVVKAFNISLHD